MNDKNTSSDELRDSEINVQLIQAYYKDGFFAEEAEEEIDRNPGLQRVKVAVVALLAQQKQSILRDVLAIEMIGRDEGILSSPNEAINDVLIEENKAIAARNDLREYIRQAIKEYGGDK
jgi:hypothetical protein